MPAIDNSVQYDDVRKLLSEIHSHRIDSDKLALLFKIGDKKIAELIQALDDENVEINTNAQAVIRYLGNEKGMKALQDWYGKQKKEYRVAGPIPLPISTYDYKFIEKNIVGQPPERWSSSSISYLYALALDDSPNSKSALAQLVARAGTLDQSSSIAYAIRQIQSTQPRRILKGQKDLSELVQKNAFFIAPRDQEYVSTKLLGFNGAKDKALIEVHIDRGILAKEWFHVVISLSKKGWKFFSIRQVAVS